MSPPGSHLQEPRPARKGAPSSARAGRRTRQPAYRATEPRTSRLRVRRMAGTATKPSRAVRAVSAQPLEPLRPRKPRGPTSPTVARSAHLAQNVNRKHPGNVKSRFPRLNWRGWRKLAAEFYLGTVWEGRCPFPAVPIRRRP